MTRFKQEMRKKGFKLEADYPWLPFHEGSLTLESVSTAVKEDIDGEQYITYSRYFDEIGIMRFYLDRNFKVSRTEYID